MIPRSLPTRWRKKKGQEVGEGRIPNSTCDSWRVHDTGHSAESWRVGKSLWSIYAARLCARCRARGLVVNKADNSSSNSSYV